MPTNFADHFANIFRIRVSISLPFPSPFNPREKSNAIHQFIEGGSFTNLGAKPMAVNGKIRVYNLGPILIDGVGFSFKKCKGTTPPVCYE